MKTFLINWLGGFLGIKKLGELQDAWYEENAPLGKDSGYPECCIIAFGEQPPEWIQKVGISSRDRKRYKAACINGEYSGFIPCYRHAKKIINGKITLGSLITNRNQIFNPFPFEGPVSPPETEKQPLNFE